MITADRRRWLRAMALLGAVYFVFGVAFAKLAGSSASAAMRGTWNRLGFVASFIAFAIHIGYEHFRLRSSTLTTASHVSIAVALGAFALAVNANVHGLSVGSTQKGRLVFALVAWPLITGVPASLVALIAASGLSLTRRR